MNYANYLYDHTCHLWRPCHCLSDVPPPPDKKIKFEPPPLRRSERIRAKTIISDPLLKEDNLLPKLI